jgi:hypothetical protein
MTRLVFSAIAAWSMTVAGQGWLAFTTVKTWTGTVSIDAVEKTPVGNNSSTVTYSATGSVTLTDNLSADPDAVHSTWPFPTPAELADPKRAPDAFKRWPAHVVLSSVTTGVDELGQKVNVQCKGDQTVPALVQLSITPMSTNYLVRIESPVVSATCSGTSVLPMQWSPGELKVELPIPPAKGVLSGTKTLTLNTRSATVTFKLTPS